MAVRLLAYLGLLYQDLVARKETLADGRLPPVVPIVLYNGEPPWDAPREVAELIAPGPAGLERYRPQLRYLLLLHLAAPGVAAGALPRPRIARRAERIGGRGDAGRACEGVDPTHPP
jgi:hypothetical protein